MTGDLPLFSALTKLISLDLSSNKLTNSIPAFTSKTLTTLILRGNRFTGSCPDFLLPKLQQLDLSSNPGLSGPVPSWANLPALRSLDLHLTPVSGELPSSFLGPSLKLGFLDFSSTRLGGSLYSACHNHSSLLFVNINNALFSDASECLQSPSLYVFHASNNKLSLSASLSWCGVSSRLLDLDVSRNPDLLTNVQGSYFPPDCFAKSSLIRVNMSGVNLLGAASDVILALPSSSISTIDISGWFVFLSFFFSLFFNFFLRPFFSSSLSLFLLRQSGNVLYLCA